MRIAKITALALALIMACSLLVACGGSEADKAYDTWAKETLVKMQESEKKFTEDFTPGADNQTKLEVLDKHLSVYKPGVEEFAKIDETKLTGEKKDTYSEFLAGYQKIVTDFEAIREEIAASLDDEGYDDEGYDDEGYDDEGYDEEEEGYEEEE